MAHQSALRSEQGGWFGLQVTVPDVDRVRLLMELRAALKLSLDEVTLPGGAHGSTAVQAGDRDAPRGVPRAFGTTARRDERRARHWLLGLRTSRHQSPVAVRLVGDVYDDLAAAFGLQRLVA
ncbi:hypothetical protein GCM10028775_26300 [Catellatospora paridis]